MNVRCRLFLLALAAVTALPRASGQTATAIHVQGRLSEGGVAKAGNVDLELRLFGALTGGTQLGPTATFPNVPLRSGFFQVYPDFGAGVFNTTGDYFVQIAWRAAGSTGAYATLGDRRQLGAAAFAHKALSADSATTAQTASQLGGQPPAYWQSAASLTTGTLPLTVLPAGLARRDVFNNFTADNQFARVGVGAAPSSESTLFVSGTDQQLLRLTGSNTGGTWFGIDNTSPGGRSWSLISTGSTNSEGAGKLLLRDNSAGAVRLTLDTDGDLGLGTSAPEGRLDVATSSNARLIFRQDGPVPGLKSGGTAGLTGFMRFRHVLEVWPNDAGTASGRVDVRNRAGNPTITLDGETGSITAKNLPGVAYEQHQRDSLLTLNPGQRNEISTVTINAPAAGVLNITAMSDTQMNDNTSASTNKIMLKLERVFPDGSSEKLVEIPQGSGNANIRAPINISHVMTVPAAGAYTFRTSVFNDSSLNGSYGSDSLIITYFPTAL